MSAQRSEGLTTSNIEFYKNGTYKIKEGTFIGSNPVEGKYSIKDSIITLNNLGEQAFIKSKHLLLKNEVSDGLVFYQLNASKYADTSLFMFYCNVP